MEYIILIVVLAVLFVGIGGAMLLRPRGGRKVRQRDAGADLTSGTGTEGGARAGTAAEDAPSGTGTATLPRPETEPAPEPVAEKPRPTPGGRPGPVGRVSTEMPPPSAGRLVRLRARLARSQSGFGGALLNLLSRDNLDDDTWEEIEEVLITADVGVTPSRQMVEDLRTKVKIEGAKSATEVKDMLRAELLTQVETEADRAVRAERHEGRPAVIMMVGVNGTGKTTTCGKLARSLVGDGKSVVLGAADTFRAAAADQLQTWGERVGAETVRSDKEGADPASVAFDAVSKGVEAEVDVVLIDTAGRLHTKTGLMDELGKVKRVIEKRTAVDEVLLVLDATTGQNGLRQARVFAEVVDVTGIVLTKLDGTARGGIVIAVQRELGVPVKLVGLGEGPDDLAPFEPAAFVDAILSAD
jgi:fused signal recognition particle receptor